MEQNVTEVFEENLNINLTEIILSNSTKKEIMTKVKVRPVIMKDKLYFQSTLYKGKQVIHYNDRKEDMLNRLSEWLYENGQEAVFRQAEIKSQTKQTNILISKKGKVTLKTKTTDIPVQERKRELLEHNRKKQYILQEGIKVPFLVDLGVMTEEGKIVHSRYDKFKQINRFLEFIEDILGNLEKDRELTIIDFGCGKSYLTFAMYYYLKELKQYDINVIGLDLKEDVITHCNKLSNQYGYEKLKFLTGDIADYEGVNAVDMVVTLHACDTATDYALEKAVKWGAKVILSVPCCQHELNQQMECGPLADILKYGLIKERMSALLTDALRANMLEYMGYKTQILEFIDMEHTPKNILIRAVLDNRIGQPDECGANLKSYEECRDFFGVNPMLYQLLKEERK